MQTKKIRASYSLLSTWAQGNIEEALLQYFHFPRETPERYREGRKLDMYAQDYVDDYGKLPPEWGGIKLKKPKTQVKIITPYNRMCDLVTIFDILDTPDLWELKSGKTSAKAYAGTLQVPLYLLQCKLAEIPVKKAIISRYNQNNGQVDKAIVLPTSKVIERARNYLDSIVPEIYKYFEDNDLFSRTDEQMIKILQNNAQ